MMLLGWTYKRLDADKHLENLAMIGIREIAVSLGLFLNDGLFFRKIKNPPWGPSKFDSSQC